MPQTELLLAGDLSSPAHVLASHHLTIEQKREILESWKRDLDTGRNLANARSLRASIRIALSNLEAFARKASCPAD